MQILEMDLDPYDQDSGIARQGFPDSPVCCDKSNLFVTYLAKNFSHILSVKLHTIAFLSEFCFRLETSSFFLYPLSSLFSSKLSV